MINLFKFTDLKTSLKKLEKVVLGHE